MMSDLKSLEDELRAEMSKNTVVRIKRGLSQDQAQDSPVARTLEAKPVKKALFAPSNLPQHQKRFPSPLTAFKSLTGPPCCISNHRNCGSKAFKCSCGVASISSLCKHREEFLLTSKST